MTARPANEAENAGQVKRFRINGLNLAKYAQAHGITAHVYVLPHASGRRVIAWVNHQFHRTITEIIAPELCEGLIGSADPGLYEIRVARGDHDPGAPDAATDEQE